VLPLLGATNLLSGDRWENVVLNTLFFRVLNCQFNSPLPSNALVPPLPPKFDIKVEYPERDLDYVLKELSKPSVSPMVILSYPKPKCFQTYDILVAVHWSASEVVIWGYQCKAGTLPTDVSSLVSKSFVLRSRDMDPGISNASKVGWTIVELEVRDAFLGPTFLPLRLLEQSMSSMSDTNEPFVPLRE